MSAATVPNATLPRAALPDTSRPGTGPPDIGGVRRLISGVQARWVEIVVLIVAVGARLGVVVRHDGLHGIIGYDGGVYFAGADALIHGRLPYRDFTMLHPPGIMLLLTPFAALTTWLTDWHAFIVATLAFCLLGGVNAVLVVTVCRRLGFSALASGLGGLFYAAWYGSVSGEFQVRLEPLGNLFLLCGLLMLLRAQRRPTRWANVLAGVVLGVTLTIKIWWGVPVVLLVLWHAWRQHGVDGQHGVRAGARTAAGAAISVIVVYAPFFLADPSGMFASVVTDQLGRSRRVPTGDRISQLTSLPELHGPMSHQTTLWAVGLFGLTVVLVLVLAWRASAIARALVALVVVQLVVLVAAPSWFVTYSDYVAVGLAVCVGAAASSTSGMRLPRLRVAPPVLLTSAVLVVTTLVTITGSAAVHSYPGATTLAHAVRNERCVMTNYTTVLIRIDALTRDLNNGCPNWIDVNGRTYGPDEQTAGPSNTPLPRSKNRKWQRDLTRYLRSGDAIILVSPRLSGIVGHTAKVIKQDGVLARAGGHTVYRVRR